MAPERKIEKLLRAYAQKRRAQAGDPLKLHPAARRLLQGEVARNLPKPKKDEASISLWELCRRHWAFLTAFAMVFFLFGSLTIFNLSKAEMKTKSVVTMSNLRQIGMAAQMAAEENNGKLPASLDTLTNGLVPDKILTDPESGKRFIYLAGGEKLDVLSSNSVLAYSPADKNGRAVLFADGEVQRLSEAKFSDLTNRRLPELAVASDSASRQLSETPAANKDESGAVATTAPPISGQLSSEDNLAEKKLADSRIATTSAGGVVAMPPPAPAAASGRLATTQNPSENNSAIQTKTVQFATAVSQNFANGLQNNFRNTAGAAQSSPVLANFQVQQNGSAIRVVDADGSVYDGSLQPESSLTQNFSGKTVFAAPTPNQQQTAIVSQTESPTAQNYFFRVAGINRTLKQNVVFAGNLLAITGMTTNFQQSWHGSTGLGVVGGFGRDQQSPPRNQLPWSNSRIAGTAVIADTNNIEINAVPLPP